MIVRQLGLLLLFIYLIAVLPIWAQASVLCTQIFTEATHSHMPLNSGAQQYPLFPVERSLDSNFRLAIDNARSTTSDLEFIQKGPTPLSPSEAAEKFTQIGLAQYFKLLAQHASYRDHAIKLMVLEFRKDKQLAQFEDAELAAAAERVLGWKLQIDSEAGLYEAPYNSRAAFEFERFRLYLLKAGINPDAKPHSFSDMLRQYNIKNLVHGTSLEGLLAILQTGKLETPKANGHEVAYYNANRSFIYAQIGSQYMPKNSRYPITIELETTILDDIPWSHFNIYWKFGVKNPSHSIDPTNMIAAFLNLVRETSSDPDRLFIAVNEFLFTQQIPVHKYVKRIHVPLSMRDEVVKYSNLNPKIFTFSPL